MAHDTLGNCCANIRGLGYYNYLARHGYFGVTPLVPEKGGKYGANGGRYFYDPCCQDHEIAYNQWCYTRYLKATTKITYHLEVYDTDNMGNYSDVVYDWTIGKIFTFNKWGGLRKDPVYWNPINESWDAWYEGCGANPVYSTLVTPQSIHLPAEWAWSHDETFPGAIILSWFNNRTWILQTDVINTDEQLNYKETATFHCYDQVINLALSWPMDPAAPVGYVHYDTREIKQTRTYEIILEEPYPYTDFLADCQAIYDHKTLQNILDYVSTYTLDTGIGSTYYHDGTFQDFGLNLIPNIVNDFNFYRCTQPPACSRGDVVYQLAYSEGNYPCGDIGPMKQNDNNYPTFIQIPIITELVPNTLFYGLVFTGTKLLVPIANDPTYGVLANTDYRHEVRNYGFCQDATPIVCDTLHVGAAGPGLSSYVGIEREQAGTEGIKDGIC